MYTQLVAGTDAMGAPVDVTLTNNISSADWSLTLTGANTIDEVGTYTVGLSDSTGASLTCTLSTAAKLVKVAKN
jgi:hypothetical protein